MQQKTMQQIFVRLKPNATKLSTEGAQREKDICQVSNPGSRSMRNGTLTTAS